MKHTSTDRAIQSGDLRAALLRSFYSDIVNEIMNRIHFASDINRRKLEAAEEMAKAARLTFESFGNKSLRIKGYNAMQAALSAWDKAGKEEV